MSVSYTHLDVYKRQVYDTDLFEILYIPVYTYICYCPTYTFQQLALVEQIQIQMHLQVGLSLSTLQLKSTLSVNFSDTEFLLASPLMTAVVGLSLIHI